MRLIDADEMLLDESEAYMSAQLKVDSITRGINEIVHRKIQMLLMDTPTVDAEPVKHGKWIEKRKKTFFEGLYEVKYICSCCGDVVYGKYNYCSDCGAKMDGGEENA